ncbi:MAG: hypothetical protein K9H64_04780 [Bacteroidales bacterium]|nr:hypothetical protein [Bacteroidales bacterium]MCF8455081.1 hypothetical protein [Bacteroidales bacterium]
MKILIDENLPVKLKSSFWDHNIFTVRDMKWDSFKNGKLLSSAIANGFDILMTSDKNLQYQQNFNKLDIALIVFNVKLLKWQFIEPLIPKAKEVILQVEKGKIYIIE